MSAPTSGSAGGSPTPGFYPDPSIPGYIRYWNGAAWVPGTSRPAPAEGEPMPAAPPGAAPAAPAPAAVEETGPVFLDEAEPAGSAAPAVRPRGEVEAAGASWDDPARLHGTSPEGAASWHADASRQSGFGEDGRVSWGASGRPPAGTPAGGAAWGQLPPQRGAESDEAAAGQAPPAAPPADGGTVTIRAVGPAARGGSGDHGTTAIRAVRPAAPPAADQGTTAFRAVGPDAGEGAHPAPKDGTMAFRLPPGTRTPNAPAAGAAPQGSQAPQSLPSTGAPAAQPPAPQPAPQADRPADRSPARPPAAAAPAPAPGPGLPPQGGAPGDDGVIPWKPPTADIFFAAAQAAQGHPAPLGRRLAARLIDTLVLAAVTLAVALPMWSTVTDHLDAKVEAAKQSGRQVTVYLVDGTTAPVFLTLLAVVLIGGGLYEVLPTLKWGRTLGKKLCGVRVLDIESHDTPRLAQAIRRWLVYGVLGVLAVGVVNALWCLVDKPWRQCWHDKAARTFVASDAASD
ncbi:RDD family protein [Streptomyces sp. RS10V-4]|uniref:RDD family protein n=1 Tax=Streptomyces rhizoryzae TaxID=2932493 RepID=UPI002003B7FF|nr:RDD family protein [Streptomyces rhizoryzae]MCK7623964.1 RDD family protein [Streptomyces rhizoryzae]